MEARREGETGIRTLKIGYNKVFGYYIEVTNSFGIRCRTDYIRKQTLVNGERYITQELKDLENRSSPPATGAALEYELFAELRKTGSGGAGADGGRAVAQLDALCSFAAVAAATILPAPVDESGVI